MITLDRLVDLTGTEIENSIAKPWEDFVLALHPGLFLQSWVSIVSVLGAAGYQLWTGIVLNLTRVPARVAAHIVIDEAAPGDKTRVLTVFAAKRYAAEVALRAVFDLAGGGPPKALGIVKGAGALKGARSRFIDREERQALGKVLHTFLKAIRSPVTAALTIIQFIWRIIVALMALGGVFVAWSILSSEWDRDALSQARERKFETVRINRRVGPERKKR